LTLNVTLKAVQVLLYTVYEFYFKLTHFAFVECFETNEYPLNKCYTSNITRCLFSLSTGLKNVIPAFSTHCLLMKIVKSRLTDCPVTGFFCLL